MSEFSHKNYWWNYCFYIHPNLKFWVLVCNWSDDCFILVFISIVLSFIWFLSLVLSQRSSPVCICHLVIPFSSPTLFSSISVLHTSQAHWRMFGCAGIVVLDSFWCAWGFVLGPALHLSLGMVASAVHQTVEVASDVFHPNPLSHFCKWGNVVPIHISLALLWWTGVWWVWSWGSTFIVVGLGFVVRLVEGGIGQSFLISKRLLDIFPALGHGVPTQMGASSRGGGLFSDVGGCWLSELLQHLLGAFVQLHCLDWAWPPLLLCIS